MGHYHAIVADASHRTATACGGAPPTAELRDHLAAVLTIERSPYLTRREAKRLCLVDRRNSHGFLCAFGHRITGLGRTLEAFTFRGNHDFSVIPRDWEPGASVILVRWRRALVEAARRCPGQACRSGWAPIHINRRSRALGVGGEHVACSVTLI